MGLKQLDEEQDKMMDNSALDNHLDQEEQLIQEEEFTICKIHKIRVEYFTDCPKCIEDKLAQEDHEEDMADYYEMVKDYKKDTADIEELRAEIRSLDSGPERQSLSYQLSVALSEMTQKQGNFRLKTKEQDK